MIGIDELVTLLRREVAHPADRLIDGLSAIRRQLLELLKKLARLLFLIGSEVLPGFHALEYVFLLLGRQTGETLEPFLQLCLLWRRQLTEFGIVL